MYSLENLFLFKGLSDDEISSVISKLSKPICFDKGDEIYNQSKFSKAMGVILSGRAEALDDNLLKRVFGEGSVFGVAALFGAGSDYVSRIVSKTECEVLFIDENALKDIFERYPVTSVNYITFLSGRIRFLNKRIKLFTCKGASAKLYQFLSENADENGVVEISNMSKLAKMTSIGRTSLYRAVDELLDSEMIERFGPQFIIR